jgi:hypothetical protein
MPAVFIISLLSRMGGLVARACRSILQPLIILGRLRSMAKER